MLTKVQEEVKEKTVFNVKLESFDAAAKPKIIREVKAIVPNLTLIDVRVHSFPSHSTGITPFPQPFLVHHACPYYPSSSVVSLSTLLTSPLQAKKFVEGVPKVLKENVTKEDAEKLQKAFEALGAVVKLE